MSRKRNPDKMKIPITVGIELRQDKWLRERPQINFSELVRQMLDRMMEENNG